MRCHVFWVSLLLVLAVFAPASPARASDQWCDTDPLVVVRTPEGALVPVFVNSGALGVQHLLAVQLARITTEVGPAGRGTLVKVRVLIPGDAFAGTFPTRTVASTGPLGTGTIYARADGSSGRTMTMTFTLPVA